MTDFAPFAANGRRLDTVYARGGGIAINRCEAYTLAMIHENPDFLLPRDRQRRVVCRMCGATLEVIVNFEGKIVWPVDPIDPDFGTQAPSLRGDTKSVRVVCSADMMHACGYVCLDGVLVESAKKR